MSEALPLGPTGSITPGRSVPAMLELAAGPYQVVVRDELRTAWSAVNHLYTHIDGRQDLDYPDSKPDGAPKQIAWDGWFDYLRNPDPEASMPDDGNLTDIQQRAFVTMREQFDVLRTSSEQRSEFVTSLWMYMAASKQAKAASVVGGRAGLAYWRQRDGLAVARLFTSIVPEADKHASGVNFGRFVHLAEYMIRTYKLFDSVNDLGIDRAHGNNSLRRPLLGAISLLGRSAWRGLAITIPHPKLVPAGADKLLAVIRNRKGKFNRDRVHV